MSAVVQPIGDRRVLERLPGGGYAYVLIDESIRIEARHLRRERGGLHAEIDVQCTWAGVLRHRNSLTVADWNLSSQPSRKTLAKHCEVRAKTKPEDFDWLGSIDAAAIEIIAAERESGDIIILDDAPDVPERNHDIDGLLLPADATSMLIAHGDSLKSLVTLYVLGTLARREIPALYLDWEWSADRHRSRKRKLFGDGRLETLHYLRCRAPLVHEADRIRRYCDEHGIAFLGVDSVGLACDGPLKDDDVAIRFHRALGYLPAALCAAHVPKSSVGTDAKDAIGPFGSVFFSNLCRLSWLVKKVSANDTVATVGLFPQKQNDGARLKPIGFEFGFSPTRIAVARIELTDVEGLAEKLPLHDRMAAILRAGPRTAAEIATALEAKPETVSRLLQRHKGTRFTLVTGTEDGVHRWALLDRRTDGHVH